ncbi:hypothetical protein KSC_037440 [Ktedonobacter sp. SOSP1-52]|uniref:hypothetical protein n=1 Tax=Ktedonobacter sp. SOSP1-52 TaxID=2778366 RepID=UPI0019165BFB|nr:hypothetical protein [Ktedonobacter sp. SOSP1-52]GHO64852.1 hypothetical protein KSC_037440 [Ktedonobacter sp. SOSP1-52]
MKPLPGIIIVLFMVYVLVLAIAARGKGFQRSWQLVKTDNGARAIALLALALLLFQGSLVLFAWLPWSGLLQWFCGLGLIVLLCLWIGRAYRGAPQE